MGILAAAILVASIVGLFTIDFDDDDNVASGPGATTTTEAPATTVPDTTATTVGSSQATTSPTSAPATTQGTTATTHAPAPTTTAAVGGTATTVPNSGLGGEGSGQAGKAPLATSGGEDMIVPACLLLVAAWFLRRVGRRANAA